MILPQRLASAVRLSVLAAAALSTTGCANIREFIARTHAYNQAYAARQAAQNESASFGSDRAPAPAAERPKSHWRYFEASLPSHVKIRPLQLASLASPDAAAWRVAPVASSDAVDSSKGASYTVAQGASHTTLPARPGIPAPIAHPPSSPPSFGAGSFSSHTSALVKGPMFGGQTARAAPVPAAPAAQPPSYYPYPQPAPAPAYAPLRPAPSPDSSASAPAPAAVPPGHRAPYPALTAAPASSSVSRVEVPFLSNATTLGPLGRDALHRVLENAGHARQISVRGVAQGTEAANIAKVRAELVKEWLVMNGVSPKQIAVRDYQPGAGNRVVVQVD